MIHAKRSVAQVLADNGFKLVRQKSDYVFKRKSKLGKTQTFSVSTTPSTRYAVTMIRRDINSLNEQLNYDAIESVRKSARFKVGDAVEIRVEADQWLPARIVQVGYREADWPPGDVVPYEVLSTGASDPPGTMRFCPHDSDECVRKRR